MNVTDALAAGAAALPQRGGIPDPHREAMWLLAAAWGVDEITLRLHPERDVPLEVAQRFRSWVERRAGGEPAHHLTGSCPFWGREFEVSSAVLVPRPETELIIEVALSLPLTSNARVLDVGTGSGCIATTLAVERPGWLVAAVDRKLPAAVVALGNMRRFGLDGRLWIGDLATAVGPPWDLIVANLPYVPTADISRLSPEVRRDPRSALDGGPDGLDLVRRLLADLPRLLRPCGGAVLEIGDQQAEGVADLAGESGLAVARRVRDVSGCERVIVLQTR